MSWRANRAETRRVQPFLRVPPFPGAITTSFGPRSGVSDNLGNHVALLRSMRIGGTFWAAQPVLPDRYLLVRTAEALSACGDQLDPALGEPLLWQAADGIKLASTRAFGDCDPWYMLSRAGGLVCRPDDEVRLVAAILGVPTFLWRSGDPLDFSTRTADVLLREVPASLLPGVNPFTGAALSLEEAIRLCGFWRDLIDGNRDLTGGIGFAAWKQGTVAPLLWSGAGAFPFLRDERGKVPGGKLAVWRSRAPAHLLDTLEAAGEEMVEVEDGFLRSKGLGADCIPPLSITVDRLGPYFDPAQPSELERLLQDGHYDAPLLARAQALRTVIVAEGLGKYERGSAPVPRFGGDKRHILVPGQVEDDRSVLTGGAGLVSNAELLARVRAKAPDAFILYKPHPDVLAGHRKGLVPAAIGRQLADMIVDDLPISSLLDMVDEVHVNTSLAGFEGLLRNKQVVTHGVPFYAGWGLTEDLGPVPARRTSRRTMDELVAATLLLYPRYLDPVTGLPCPAEVVVARLCANDPAPQGTLVSLRRMQGQVMRRFRSLVA